MFISAESEFDAIEMFIEIWKSVKMSKPPQNISVEEICTLDSIINYKNPQTT